MIPQQATPPASLGRNKRLRTTNEPFQELDVPLADHTPSPITTIMNPPSTRGTILGPKAFH